MVTDITSITTAFILGAGRGERLRPMTEEYPKPLLLVRGRPVITYVMDHLLSVGVKKFIVNTHHRAERYAEVFPEGNWRGVPIDFRYEPVLLNTGGGLKNIEDLIQGEEHLWVYNGDIISDLPLSRLAEVHLEGQNEVTLALRTKGKNLNVGVDRDGRPCDFRFVLGRKCHSYRQFAGIYLVRTEFLSRLPAGVPIDIVTVFIDLVKEKPDAIGGVIIDEGTWDDVGDVATYRQLNE
ncbi:MAG: sugar phosphate nucleotidyltransferase [Syntrophales bacterium]|nr:sugar phosphate nucleotidyltransferase [Syntrophales bacterium]